MLTRKLTLDVLVTLVVTVFFCNAYITWIAVRLPLAGEVAAPGAPWPLPRRWVNSTNLKTLNPDTVQFVTNADSCDVISEAVTRYKALLKLDDNALPDSLPSIDVINVIITDTTCSLPNQQMIENYTLTIDAGNTVSINAPAIWGALRGLETFSQLLYLSDKNTYRINETTIIDYPRYSYRGLMIDTARHFLTKSTIYRILDGMEWDKLNVLHWHIVDDQSFAYNNLQSFPNMSQFGAYSSFHQYSASDVDDIKNYARLRGIRVIPEFDTPGHTNSWGRALPRLLTPCWGAGLEGGPYVPNYPTHAEAEILNPTDEYVYDVLAQIYNDVTRTFPTDYIHLGLDEVYYACWQSNPNISSWMVTQNFTTYYQVEEYYQRRLIEIVRALGSKFIMWQDPIDHNAQVEKDALIEVWKDEVNSKDFSTWEEYMLNITLKGYQTILSAPWYLNVISYGQDWRNYYLVEPNQFTEDKSLQSLVMGGEACVWAEYIDGGNILSTLWHRLSAVSERLWSDASVRDADSAAYRLDQHRCRYVKRGIPAKPVLPGYCGDYEWVNN